MQSDDQSSILTRHSKRKSYVATMASITLPEPTELETRLAQLRRFL
jgi:hypothetical protein